LAAFSDPKTVSFLDKKEVNFCIKELKQMYSNSKTSQSNYNEPSLANSQNSLDGGLSIFAFNSDT
jgi:hypothetical protein